MKRKTSPEFRLNNVLALIVLIVVTGAIATPVAAQGLLSLTGASAGSSKSADRERALRLARTSFEHFTADVVDANASVDTRRAVDAITRDFAAATERTLLELEGDGILGVAEVETELGTLREDYAQEVRTVVSAMEAGYPPPPLQSDFADSGDYVLALIEYAITQRNAPSRWVLVVLCLAAGLVSAWALNAGAGRLRNALANKRRRSSAQVVNSLAGPLYLTALSCGLYFGVQQLWLPTVLRDICNGAVNLMLVGALFWLCWSACPGLASGTAGFIRRSYEHEIESHAIKMLERLLRIMVISAMALVVVKLVLDTSLVNLLAGLGIVGLALYFILRGTLENVAASFTIFGDKPFRVGDLVIYDDAWGNIEDIGFRSTRVRTLRGYLITVPNNEMISTAVTNVGERPTIRRRFRLGLTYETPPDQVRAALDIVADILADHEGMPDDRPPKVEFEAFGDYDLRLIVEYHYEPADFWQALHFDTHVNLRILERFRDAGINIAYPTERHLIATDTDSASPRFELVGTDAGVPNHDTSAGEESGTVAEADERAYS